MEPDYVGPNNRINAMAVAQLFADDFAFFNSDEISWDGEHHAMAGIQFNAAKVDDFPVFVQNIGQLVPNIYDFMAHIEQDEELIVPRWKIAPGLHDAIREGDLTGITLFNLQACGKAFLIQGDGDDYLVFFDSRLGMGIPGFYRLITRLVEDMRSYNQIGGSARVTFSVVRNFDASEYLDDVPAEVPGAFYESFHVEETCSESRPADNVQDESKRILESNTGAAAMAYATQIIGDIQPDESSPVLRFIDGACSQKVDAENLIRVVNALGDAFALLASQFAVGMLNEFGDPNDPLGIIEMAFTGITLQLTFNNQVASVFTKLLDAYDVQVNYQTTPEERTMLLDALDQFGKHTFLSADMFPDSLLQQDYVNDIEWLSKEDKACFKRLRADRKSLKQKKPKSSK